MIRVAGFSGASLGVNVLALVSLVSLVVLTPGAVGAATADEIITRHLQARGGEVAWQQVDTFRLQGTVTSPDDPAAADRVMRFILELKRPDSIRFEFSIGDREAVQAYDGEAGWAVMPTSSDTVPMPEDKVQELKAQNDIDGPLLRSRQDGYTVTLVGTQEVEGRSAHHLEVSGPAGDVVGVFVDSESFLELKRVRERTLSSVTFHEIRLLSDYRQVGDLLMPHTVTVSNDRNNAVQLVTYASIELEVELDDSRFRSPAASPEDQGAAKK